MPDMSYYFRSIVAIGVEFFGCVDFDDIGIVDGGLVGYLDTCLTFGASNRKKR